MNDKIKIFNGYKVNAELGKLFCSIWNLFKTRKKLSLRNLDIK